ncbi:MAG TPA: acetyltransferase [Stellaceae bacterium]|nr:acetyltransferase [Stellaceae bacterium]
MSPPILVIGGGGHGRVVIEALLAAGEAVAGVIDPHPGVAALLPDGVPWLGGEEALSAYKPETYQLANGVGGIGEPHRRDVFERLSAAGYGFVRVRHPAASVARAGVVLGEGAQIMAGAVIQPGVRIGANAIVNTRAAIDHDCRVGEHCHIAPGAVLCGDVTIGAGTHVGAGAVLIQGVAVGAFSIIGAGAIILRDVPDGVVVYSKDIRQERRR